MSAHNAVAMLCVFLLPCPAADPHRYVWASLLPIVGGCSLSAMKEVSFSWGGFNNAMISNLGMVLRNIYSKKQLNDYKVRESGFCRCFRGLRVFVGFGCGFNNATISNLCMVLRNI
jgi:hypothetical protein